MSVIVLGSASPAFSGTTTCSLGVNPLQSFSAHPFFPRIDFTGMSSPQTLLVEVKPSRRRLISSDPDRVSTKMTAN